MKYTKIIKKHKREFEQSKNQGKKEEEKSEEKERYRNNGSTCIYILQQQTDLTYVISSNCRI